MWHTYNCVGVSSGLCACYIYLIVLEFPQGLVSDIDIFLMEFPQGYVVMYTHNCVGVPLGP